jgi:hypothetical protein
MSRHALDLCVPATITPKKANCITECFLFNIIPGT